ncbi:MAG: hypothetical protein Q9227_005903 [Pyrenula ochraceoflavens]
MHPLLLLVFLAGILPSCLSRFVPRTHVAHEKREVAVNSWVKRGRVHPRMIVSVRIGLTQSDLHLGHEYLMDISHPASPNYGKHWTEEEVTNAFAPSQESLVTVTDWLKSSGIAKSRISHSHNKGWLAFDASVGELEGLLHAAYHKFEHKASGRTTTACDVYHIPRSVRAHVDYVTPGIKLHAPTHHSGIKRRSTPDLTSRQNKLAQEIVLPTNLSDLSNCSGVVTPACIRALYELPIITNVNSNNSLGIYEDRDYYAQEDLDLFFSRLAPNIPNGTHPVPALIDGVFASAPVDLASAEPELDFQLAYPLIYPQQITLYQVDDNSTASRNSTGFLDTFLDGLDGSFCTYSAYGQTGNNDTEDMIYPDPTPGGYTGPLQCGNQKPTNVISVSYGSSELWATENYLRRQCNEFMKLALQGHTILFASGDYGVTGLGDDDDDSFNYCAGPNHTIFNPESPVGCPYITSVGWTTIDKGNTVYDPEVAFWDGNFSNPAASGGGFSNMFTMPPYQAPAVEGYFSDHSPPYSYYWSDEEIGANDGLFMRDGRGYPDVSANGLHIPVYVGGELVLEGGTSASSPLFASVINLINEQRLAVGKNPVGFINPALYAHPYVLNDITEGKNPGCGTAGFHATPGWDPVTGLGTPNYPKMLELFMSLP